MRRFFIEQSETTMPEPVIKGTDATHIAKVLRLGAGEIIFLFDGTGAEYKAKIVSFAEHAVKISIIKKYLSESESPVQITLAQAFLKQKKMDRLVRQITELGINKWIPVVTERSVSRPDGKRLVARIKRWKEISKQALKQCNRARIMTVNQAVSFEDALNLSKQSCLKIIFWENEPKPFNPGLSEFKGNCNNIFIIIGPEGGFTLKEIEKAKACGFITASLGPRILRAETAAIAASVLIQSVFGDITIKNS
jgi:16S rRNA (uracil1498-N3)-methyltransferase